jgi:hypothetical protein
MCPLTVVVSRGFVRGRQLALVCFSHLPDSSSFVGGLQPGADMERNGLFDQARVALGQCRWCGDRTRMRTRARRSERSRKEHRGPR